MTYYIDDKNYTDYIHDNIAIPKIYEPLGWKQIPLVKEEANYIDMNNGIDYIFEKDGRRITVQERFREKKYERYNDFTIRYRRDENKLMERVESEYYKITADYFTYGITNGSKTNLSTCTDFVKYVIIDLTKIFEKINTGKILIVDNKKNVCQVEEDKLVCPIKYNTDSSSSFVPIDITLLIRLFGDNTVVKRFGY